MKKANKTTQTKNEKCLMEMNSCFNTVNHCHSTSKIEKKKKKHYLHKLEEIYILQSNKKSLIFASFSAIHFPQKQTPKK